MYRNQSEKKILQKNKYLGFRNLLNAFLYKNLTALLCKIIVFNFVISIMLDFHPFHTAAATASLKGLSHEK